MSVDQFEEAKEASQKLKYGRKVEATAMGSSLQKIDRVES